eukprot:8200074-Pyramimonas_sp.AAC.1
METWVRDNAIPLDDAPAPLVEPATLGSWVPKPPSSPPERDADRDDAGGRPRSGGPRTARLSATLSSASPSRTTSASSKEKRSSASPAPSRSTTPSRAEGGLGAASFAREDTEDPLRGEEGEEEEEEKDVFSDWQGGWPVAADSREDSQEKGEEKEEEEEEEEPSRGGRRAGPVMRPTSPPDRPFVYSRGDPRGGPRGNPRDSGMSGYSGRISSLTIYAGEEDTGESHRVRFGSTNQTQEAWVYSHDGPIRRSKIVLSTSLLTGHGRCSIDH